MPFRSFDFPVDKDYARRHNELIGDRRRLQVSALILTIALALGAYFAYFNGLGLTITALLSILAIVAGLLIILIPAAVGSVEKTFRKSSLAPAIIVDTRENGLTLLALVNAARDPFTEPIWALTVRDVREVPGARRAVGQRIPSVAVTGSQKLFNKKPYWDLITPMPISWGTDDRTVIKEAKKHIPEEEWKRLEGLKGRLEDVRQAPNDVLFL